MPSYLRTRAYWRLTVGALALLLACFVALFTIETQVSAKEFEPNVSVRISDISLDPEIFQNGSEVCSRDLTYEAERIGRFLSQRGYRGQDRLLRTADFIHRAKATFPQATMFRYVESWGKAILVPQNWSDNVMSRSVRSYDVAVVGGELASITTAMAAADRGFRVALVYAGPLGGVSAASGANLRFFDNMGTTTHTPQQHVLFHDVLGMIGWTSVPLDAESRLKSFLEDRYAGRIDLIETQSFDSLHVRLSGSRLEDILTGEGAQIEATSFIDTDVESRVAEKCGLRYSVDTPSLASGMVFDVNGLTPEDWRMLQSHVGLHPDEIMASEGVSLGQVQANSRASHVLALLEKQIANDSFRSAAYCKIGYVALSQAYHFKMLCRGIMHPEDKGLEWLNSRRMASGFNIGIQGSTACFNDFGYRLKRRRLQQSHSLEDDPDLWPIRKIEIPAIQDYFRQMTGNSSLTVRMPKQFYLRGSSAFFETLHPYKREEFNQDSVGPFHTYYPMDLRDLFARDEDNWQVVRQLMRESHGLYKWDCRASAAQTRIENLYLVNQCAVTPAFSGGQRIQANQMNMGAAVVASLPAAGPTGR